MYNMRPENWYIAYFKGFEVPISETIELFWIESIYSNRFSIEFYRIFLLDIFAEGASYPVSIKPVKNQDIETDGQRVN